MKMSLRGGAPKPGRNNPIEIASPAKVRWRARNDKLETPSQLGYRMGAEWEPHEATWLAWPHNEETWPGQVPEVQETYLQMMEALLPGEKVRLLVNDEAAREKVSKKLRSRGVREKNVVYYLVPTVDAWVRDYGPNFILRNSGPKKEAAFVKWGFNAWGGKYDSLAEDDRVGGQLAPLLGIPVFRPGMILEGGSIDPNGEGACLTTEQCLLNPNRNRGLSKSAVEETLKNFLGFTHFIWLGEGIEGDDTDGHIDDIARFVNPTTVVAAVEEDSSDPNQAVLKENLKRLREATDQKGRKLALVTVPMPGKVEGPGGRVPASYMNFYIANGVVLVPIFGHANDPKALSILKDLFPKRKVIGVRSETLVLGLGGIHCVTHEEPAV